MMIALPGSFEPRSLLLLIPIGLIIAVAVALSLVVAKFLGTRGVIGYRLIILIGFCALIPILDLLHDIVGDWAGMNDVFAAMVYGPIVFLVAWPIVGYFRKRLRQQDVGTGTDSDEQGQTPEPMEHVVTLATTGRGRRRLVQASCEGCDWSVRRTGLGLDPERQVRRLAAKHAQA